MLSYLATLRLLNRDIRLLLAMWALTAFAYFGIQGVLLNLYLLRLGYGPQFIGLLIGSGQLVWGVSALPAGMIGQRLGLRTALLVAHPLLALGAGGMLLAEQLPDAWQAAGLMAGWMVMWLGASLMTVNATPYLMAQTGLAERNHAFAMTSAVQGFFALAGSVVAGVLPTLVSSWPSVGASAATPYRISLWLAPAFYLSAFVAVSAMRPVTSTRHAPAFETKERAPLGFLMGYVLLVFLIAASEGSLRAFFNVYLDSGLGLQVGQIGSIMGISQVLPVAAALASPLVMARQGIVRTIWTMGAGSALGLALVALIPHWLAAATGYMLMIAANSIGSTARGIFGQESVHARWRTTSSAMATVGLALGWALTAAGGGLVIAWMGYQALFLAGAVMALGAAILTITLWGRAPVSKPVATGTGL